MRSADGDRREGKQGAVVLDDLSYLLSHRRQGFTERLREGREEPPEQLILGLEMPRIEADDDHVDVFLKRHLH